MMENSTTSEIDINTSSQHMKRQNIFDVQIIKVGKRSNSVVEKINVLVSILKIRVFYL